MNIITKVLFIHKKQFKTKGFTLIELLLVVSLLGITFGVTSDILISLVRSQLKTQTMNNLEQQANFIALKIEKDLRHADFITQNGNGFNISGRLDYDEFQISYTFNSSESSIYRSYQVPAWDWARDSVPLNNTVSPGGVKVECLGGGCFTVIDGNPDSLKVSLRISPSDTATAINPVNTGNIDIDTTFVVRGSY